MSVQIKYKGRIGNHLFQYAFARMLAEKNGFKLDVDWQYSKFLKVTKPKKGTKYKSPIIYIQDTLPFNEEYLKNYKIEEIFMSPLSPGRYIMSGYFENAKVMNENIDSIKGFFKLPKPNNINKSDVLVNLRVGSDFNRIGKILNPNYYLDALSLEEYNKIYITGISPNEPYLAYFQGLNFEVLPSSPKGDFEAFFKFDKIIGSNSTFAWWGIFLSPASRVYIPKAFTSPFLNSCRDATVLDADFLLNYQSPTSYKTDNYKKIDLRKNIKSLLKKIMST